MSSTKYKLRLAGALAALATLALAISCRGFFVNPTLTSISVSPASATIDTGTTNNTVQMTALGKFDDGSTGHASVTWSIAPTTSGDPTAANIDPSTGLVTSVTVGRMTVTATATQASSITGTASVLVVPPTLDSITLNPTSASVALGGTVQFTATGTQGSNSYDISKVATWISSNTSVATIDATGNALASSTTTGTTNITATLDGVTSPATLLTVTP
jgi:hypothetical protein